MTDVSHYISREDYKLTHSKLIINLLHKFGVCIFASIVNKALTTYKQLRYKPLLICVRDMISNWSLNGLPLFNSILHYGCYVFIHKWYLNCCHFSYHSYVWQRFKLRRKHCEMHFTFFRFLFLIFGSHEISFWFNLIIMWSFPVENNNGLHPSHIKSLKY